MILHESEDDTVQCDQTLVAYGDAMRQSPYLRGNGIVTLRVPSYRPWVSAAKASIVPSHRFPRPLYRTSDGFLHERAGVDLISQPLEGAFSSQTKNFWSSSQQFDQMPGGLFGH